MSAEQTSAKDDEILARRKDVWQRRVRGQTVREIADEMGVGLATVHRDLEAVRKELDEFTMHAAEVERAVGAGRLDKVARKLLEQVDFTAEPGELSTLANAVARIEERRAKLLGLDKPFETIIHQTEASPEEARRLMAEKFGRTAKQLDKDLDSEQSDDEQPQAV